MVGFERHEYSFEELRYHRRFEETATLLRAALKGRMHRFPRGGEDAIPEQAQADRGIVAKPDGVIDETLQGRCQGCRRLKGEQPDAGEPHLTFRFRCIDDGEGKVLTS